jgi:RNA polymerase sigma-70 factor (ECF subfamily)
MKTKKAHVNVAHWNDEEIVLELRAGERKEEALKQLFNSYYVGLCSFANSILKNIQEAEDTVQELIVEFYKKQLYHDLKGELRPYLISMCKSRSLNKLKSMQRKSRQLQSYRDLQADADVAMPTFDTSFDMLSRLQEALQGIPLRQQQVIELVGLQGQRYQEAADRMQVSKKAVKLYLRIARQRLSKQLGDLL